jgi:hypothetical protein
MHTKSSEQKRRGPKASYRDPAIPVAAWHINGFNALLRQRIAIEALRRQVTIRELVEGILDRAIP